MTIGRVAVRHEFRVVGQGPVGEFDHGWRRQTRDNARRHAEEMAGHPDVGEVRLEHRVVEAEVIDIETFGHRRTYPPPRPITVNVYELTEDGEIVALPEPQGVPSSEEQSR